MSKFIKDRDTLGSTLLTAYVSLLALGLSLYAPDGFLNLGEAKFLFYRAVSLVFTALLLPLMIRQIRETAGGRADGEGVRDGHGRHDAAAGRLLPWDAAALLCCLFLSVSWLLAADRAESLWGTAGWRMGACTQLLCFFFYFAARLFRIRWNIVLTFAQAGSLFVFILTIINQSGADPLNFHSRESGFYATIGIPDWYIGYLAVFLPLWAGSLVFYDFFFHEKRRAGGSPEKNAYRNAHKAFLVFGLAAGLITGARIGSATLYFVMIAFVTAMLSVFLIRRKHKRMAIVPIVFYTAAWLTCQGGVSIYAAVDRLVLLRMSLEGSPVTWVGDRWANGRDTIYRLAGAVFQSQPLSGKLFGIGPDGFAAWLSRHPDFLQVFRTDHLNVRLTNAHNEILTALVCEGVLFTAAYAVFQLLLAARFLRGMFGRGEEVPVSGMPGQESRDEKKDRAAQGTLGYMLIAVCSAAHIFTFKTVLTMPFLLLLEGALISGMSIKHSAAEHSSREELIC